MGVEPTYEELLKKNKKLEQEAALRIDAMVALDNRLELYSTLVENASDLIHSVTPDGSFIYVNQAWSDALGYNLEDLSQIKLMDIVDESCRSKCRNIFNCLIQGQFIDRNETTFVSKDGKKIVVEGRCSTKFEDDKPVAMTGIFRDVSKRVQNELALRESEEKYRTLFENATDLIQAVHPDGRLLYVNRAWMKTFGYNQKDIDTGLSIFDLISPDCQKHCQTTFQKVIASEEVQYIDTCFVAKDGTRVIIEGNACCKFQDGEPVVTQCIFRDVTEKKKMEAELFQAHKIQAIGTLAGGIAHDFNNILAAIFGYADLAKIDLPDGSHSKNYIDQILKAGNRAKELVKQILTFSRKGQETQQPLQPSPIIKEALKLMRASLPTTIEIREEIDSDCGSIIANPTNVHQVLVNLCTNALHAMEEEKGILTVKLTQVELKEHDLTSQTGVAEGSFVKLMVKDTGCGMNKATVERIFEPYFTTKEFGKGTGMGLALVHGIVQGCGGFIKVESKPGKGSTFHVYFPVTEEKAEKVKEEKQEPLPKGDERILAVDDEEVIVGLYKAILERLGYKVTAHCSSEKALEAFQSSPDSFDLVITDQTMPHLPGSELAKEILQIRPDIPIIFCTGYSSMVSEEKAKEIGIERFAMKPVSNKDLVITVREVLDKSNTKAV